MSPAHAGLPADQIDLTATGPGRLEITAVSSDAIRATVQVRGELDLANTDMLSAVLDDQLRTGRRFVLLDMSALTFMDCAGLRVLVHAHNTFLAARGTLVLTGVGARITRLLEITHLGEALFVADRPGDARRVGHLRSLPTVPAR